MSADDSGTRTRAEHVAEVRAAFEFMIAATEVVRELAGKEDGIPSGELYAYLMKWMSYQTYTTLISKLKAAKLITLKYHVIRWVGPKKEK